ncbi:MAG: S41 family peptidase [Streptosporangiaceae bacterium]
MTESRYFRYPNLHGDQLTFVADDDVWLAPAGGGRAWRISADRAQAAGPKFSGDGGLVAWTSWRDGPPEIYLASTGGGDVARVSYWSNQGTRLRGWNPAGEILATTAADQPFQHYTWAYAIPVSDGAGRFAENRRLPYGPAGDIAIDAASIALLTSSYQDPAFWKRYRGGTSGRLWVADQPADGSQPSFRRLAADLAGQFHNPMLAGGRLAFLSDFEGVGNIYSCALDGSDLRRHTDNDAMYARNASTDGTRIVYQCAGEIWMLADLNPDSEPVKLDITLGAPASGRATKLISAGDHLDGVSCDASGQASAVQVRGTVHWLTHREGPARALSPIPGPVARQPRVLGDTGNVIWVIEVDGADALEIGPADGLAPGEAPRRIATGQIGWVGELAAAPDGRVAAVAARDGRLLIVTVESGEVAEVARSGAGRISDLAFSPDSAWLAWSQPEPGDLRRLRLARLADRQVADITDGRFVDTDPVFTPEGLYLAFLSKRNFDPVYDAHFFDLSFPYGSRPFLLTLAASTPSPFGPLVGGRPVGAAKDAEDDKDAQGGNAATDGKSSGTEDAAETGTPETKNGKGKAKAKPVAIDLDGLSTRVVQVPVPESRYSSLRAAEGGLAWLREPLSGNLGEGGAKLDEDHPRPSLEYFEIKRSKCTELADAVNWFEASGDGNRLVIRDGHQLTVVPANRKADPDNNEDRISVDLSRARFLADPAGLWRAAFEEAGRAMRHEFWIPDMADVDWDGALAQYRPLLDRIATSDDFADVLHEAVAELGSSHAYIMPADGSDSTGQVAGQLGADLEPDSDGWRVARIVPGESSDPRARSPLAAPGAQIAVGDVVVAVDGRAVDTATGPAPLLVGAAGKPVELTVRRVADGKHHRAVVVPLRSDLRLRYQDWVAGRRQLVRDRTNGRAGYLHVPDMVSEGWSDFHRDLRGEMEKEALIVDVRSNRGGHTSQLIVEKLARRVIGWDTVRYGRPESYPVQAPRGPVVAVTDEFAGSDGDIVTAAIQIMKIGTVVGARTWGGVIGIEGWHQLVDGTSMTMPKFSFWFSQFGWGVENYGVDPDIELLMTPNDWISGTDVQLERAVSLAMEALQAEPAAAPPDTTARPSRRRPALPARPGAAG